jgi:WS/DGAT C-terminal domain
VCTNVPGPQYPLYLLGHKMLDWYPYVPVGGEMAVNCAILSYDGTVYFGFSGDVHAAPDLGRLEEFLKTSFEESRKAAGLEREASPRRKKAPAKPRVGSTDGLAREAGDASIPCAAPEPVTRAESADVTHDEDKVLTELIA